MGKAPGATPRALDIPVGLGAILRLMVPPPPGEMRLDILRGLAESVATAVLGTLIAAPIAVPLGSLGAGNVVTNALLRFSLRRFFDGVRGVDRLIWALTYVRAVGLGPLAGVLATATADTAVLAKLYAEAVEDAERRPPRAGAAGGAAPGGGGGRRGRRPAGAPPLRPAAAGAAGDAGGDAGPGAPLLRK